MSLGGAGGSLGAAELEAALATGAPTVTNTALTGGSGLLTGAAAGITPESVASKLAADVPLPTSGYYNEITGDFINDPLGGLTEPLTNATSGTNIGSMEGYNYNPQTGDWTLPTGEVIETTINPNPVTDGGEIMRNAGALPPVAPPPPAASTNPLSSLTPSQLANILKGAVGLFGAAGAGRALSGGGGGGSSMGVGALPTQGVPLNSQDYFNAIQQNYNTLMPAMPKDVATPLANWYNSQYGA